MDAVRTDEEVARVESWAFEGVSNGSHYPSMSYEEGVMDTIMWLRGDNDDAPGQED